jgi:phytanoyl-CoA hydroxylase
MSNISSTSVLPSRASYEQDGVVLVRSLFAEREMDDVRDRFTDQLADAAAVGWDDGVPSDDPLARYPRFVHPHRQSGTPAGDLSRRLMLDPRLLRVVTELIGPALGAQSMFYFKPPTARGQAMHQDNLFLQAHPETCLAAWIAVDAADGGNGGLFVVPGSHRLNLLCPEDADQDESFTDKVIRLPAGMSRTQTELNSGDVLFFHGSLAHGSPPNTSDHRFRRSLIFHFIPAASTEIAEFYQPLVSPGGDEVQIAESPDGGPCGTGFAPVNPG